MPCVPMTIRVFVGLVILAATLADSCLRGATQEIAPVQRPSDAPPIPGFTPGMEMSFNRDATYSATRCLVRLPHNAGSSGHGHACVSARRIHRR